MRSALLLAAVLLLPAAARAQPVFGLRLAYAPSLGSVAEETPASELMRAQIPIQADALWRFGAAAAGVYVSWGFAHVGGDGCEGADCSGSALRLGVQGLYSLAPLRDGAVPWVGAGAGWERATRERARLGSEVSWTWSGLEALVQAGVEWPLRRGFAVGPFLQLAFGRYSDLEVDTSPASGSADVDRALHGWLHVGVRGTFAPR